MLIYSVGRRVQLYVIDLNSANGTFVNNSRIEPQKYVQVLEKVRYVGYFSTGLPVSQSGTGNWCKSFKKL